MPQSRELLQITLPREAYVSSEHYQQERERIFHHEWFYVGREEAIPQVGDYLQVDVADESVLIVRTRNGSISAHYNVCRHRGCQLSLVSNAPATCNQIIPTSSFKKVITCPYHAWTYELSGELRSAPFLTGNDDLHTEDLSLYPVGVESWGGFVFVNLSPEDASARRYSLADQLGLVPERIHRYPLADLRIARRIVYEVAANWKVIVENYNECYHCGPVHPELCRIVPDFKKNGGAGLEWEDGIPHAEGMVTFTLDGTTTRAPFPGLSETEIVRHKGELIYPNMMLSLSMDHVAAFMLLPQDQGNTIVVCDFLFHPDEINNSNFDPSDAVDFWDMVNKQDWLVCEGVQKGMSSRVFKHGYYAPMEDLSADIRNYLHDKLKREPDNPQ
jgi:Rieske 2Fe-2S family protein